MSLLVFFSQSTYSCFLTQYTRVSRLAHPCFSQFTRVSISAYPCFSQFIRVSISAYTCFSQSIHVSISVSSCFSQFTRVSRSVHVFLPLPHDNHVGFGGHVDAGLGFEVRYPHPPGHDEPEVLQDTREEQKQLHLCEGLSQTASRT